MPGARPAVARHVSRTSGIGAASAPGTKAGGRSDGRRETCCAGILGAPPGTIAMHQNVTVAQSIVASCCSFDGTRRKIVMQDLDFPTNHYLFEGFRRYGAETVYVQSDDAVSAPIDRLVDAIDDRTVLVPDLARPVSERVPAGCAARHREGPPCRRDGWCSTSTRPRARCRSISTALGVDFAVGGSVKWLCGGPGAGYLYVRPDRIRGIRPAVVGWAGHVAPFGFETGVHPLRGHDRTVSERDAKRPRAVCRPRRIRDRGRDRRPGDSREVTTAHPKAHRGRAGARLAAARRRPATPSGAVRS